MAESFSEWARKGLNEYKESTTCETEEGRDIYRRLWTVGNQPESKEEWIVLIEETNAFLNNPNTPIKDKELIEDVYEGALMIAAAYMDI